MAVLSHLEPQDVFNYFEQICAIPHGSGDTKRISDYLVSFAKENALKYIQDEANNVIVFKEGTAGYENSAPVILQGHIDMVCEKESDCDIDFANDGLTLELDGDIISAKGTTLGGDDGIAVAYAMAILASTDIPHPPIEAVFTVDEEIGMLGATALDCSPLNGRIMLNMDSEDEGYLLVSCAGGSEAACHLPVNRSTMTGLMVTLEIADLTGGHSGVEIDKGRANANQLLGRTLYEMSKVADICLCSVNGGLKDNAIPRDSKAVMLINEKNLSDIQACAAKMEEIYRSEYRTTDPNLKVRFTAGAICEDDAMDKDSTFRVIAALLNLPGGIQRMSAEIEGLVQTSLNMGILKTLQDEVVMIFAVRSSMSTEKEEVYGRLYTIMQLLGGSVDRSADYPAWEYKPDSKLRDLMVEVFEEQYGRKPVVHAIHAGVECGLFSGKLPGLDCVSFGPDMLDIHTPQERMSIASVERTWKFTLEVLKRLK